jgi:hypothetical protein
MTICEIAIASQQAFLQKAIALAVHLVKSLSKNEEN